MIFPNISNKIAIVKETKSFTEVIYLFLLMSFRLL